MNPLLEAIVSWFIVVRGVEPSKARRLAELWLAFRQGEIEFFEKPLVLPDDEKDNQAF